MPTKATNKPLIVIVGQTASGKSALALELAQRFNGEIICADSRTVYKGMDIGTAKPSKIEQQTVEHHLLDVVTPDQRFTVADFKRLANAALEDITTRGKLPIMVGGTGLYIDAVIYNYQFVDESAKRDQINPRHLSKEVQVKRDDLRPNTLIIGLELDKAVLQQRIANRVEAMLKAGLVNEVKNLVKKYGQHLPAFNAPGYKPFIEYMNGSISLEAAKSLFIKNDTNLAKRQKTWFKRNKSIHWVEKQGHAVDIATTFLNKTST